MSVRLSPLNYLEASNFSEEEIVAHKAAFALFDKNGNGKISQTELSDVMLSLGKYATVTELEQMIKEADSNGDGTIDFLEFLELMARKKDQPCTMEKDLREAFKLFDQDGNGYISGKELKFVLNGLGHNFTDQEIEKIIRDVDVDGDGRVNYEEFIRALNG